SKAKRAALVGERWHAILSKKLNFYPGGVIPMYLYPNRRAFAEATGAKPDESIVGMAHTRTLKVRVDASDTFAKVESIIPHELVHVFISRRLKAFTSRMPLWMHEGLAKYLTNDWSPGDAELLREIGMTGRIIPLNKISQVFPDDDKQRAIAYVESCSVVDFMVKRYSPESVPDLLSELSKGTIFSTALEYSIGVRPEKLEEEWRQYLWDEYGFDRWVRLGSATISLLMALFAIIAFRARLLKKRRKAAELEKEFYENYG
ncbi:MAG: peptidase MA family metallohydrolase, partial [Armatimonadota bacterium]|nr:peptidase MA family metallohydrolase [Armatimonadota bacterium]